MGGIFSTSKKEVYIDVNRALSYIDQTLTVNSQNTIQTSTNMNNLEIEFGKDSEFSGNVNATQTIYASQEVNGNITSQVKTALQANLISEFNAQIDQAANSKSGWFAINASRDEMKNTLKSNLQIAIIQTFEERNYQQLLQQTINTNNGKVTIHGKFTGNLVYKQGIVSNIIAVNVISSIIDRTNSLLFKDDTSPQIRQMSTSDARGLDEITGQFTNGLKISCIIFAILLCILISSLLVIGLSPAGQKSINKYSK